MIRAVRDRSIGVVPRGRAPRDAALVSIACALCLALSPLAAAADGDAETRWIPGINIHSGVLGLQGEASVSSPDRGAFDDENRPLVPFVSSELELATPVLPSIPGGPRLFVHGGLELLFDINRSVINEGDPGTPFVIVFDPDGDGQDVRFPPEDLVTGTGSGTQAKMEQVAFVAGAGISFGFQLGDRELRVKPSVEYRYDAFEVRALLSDARSIAMDGVCPCRTTEIRDLETRSFHSLGPGIELELDAVRTSSMVMSIFATLQGLRVLGEREVEVRASGFFDTGDPASVVSRFERDPWSVRGGVGVRFRWLPED